MSILTRFKRTQPDPDKVTPRQFTQAQSMLEVVINKIVDLLNYINSNYVKRCESLQYIGSTTKDFSGFSDRAESTMSFNTTTRVFSITPAGASFTFYVRGVLFTKTSANTITIPNSSGNYYIYFDANGEIKQSTTPWEYDDEIAQICILLFRASPTADSEIYEQRHGLAMPWATQSFLYDVFGTTYISGLSGSFTASNTFSMSAGVLRDADIRLDVAAATQCRVIYRSGSLYTGDPVGTAYYKEASGIIQYDNAGTLTNVDNNKYVAYFMYAAMGYDVQLYSLVGHRQDVNLANAIANNGPESVDLSAVAQDAEPRLLYRIILKRSGTSETVEEVTDYRGTQASGVSVIPADHGSLTGRGDDDHPNNPYSPGRSGGQTIIGGTAAGEGINFKTTSHPTKGKVIFGNAGTTVYDEVNERLGVGTASPAAVVDLIKTHSSGTTEDLFKAGFDANWNLRLQQNYVGAGDIRQIFKQVYSGATYDVLAFKGGDVGIGNSNPSRRLHVDNDVNADYVARIRNTRSSAGGGGMTVDAGVGGSAVTLIAFYAYESSTLWGYIENTAGGVCQLVDASDERLKEDIAPTQVRALDKLKALPVKEFKFRPGRGNNNKVEVGFVAQDCEAVIPEMVSTDWKSGQKGTAKQVLIPYLVKAIQEQQDEIEALKDEVAALKALRVNKWS